MNSYFRMLRGFLRVHVKGYGATRLINICSKRNMKLWNVEKTEEGYYLNLFISDFRKIPEIVRKTKVKVVIVEKHGLPFLFVKMSYRKFFVIGAFLCFGWLIFMSRFVWAFEIEGNVCITDEMVLDYLSENNISMGTKLSDIDAEGLEKLFRTEFDDITWISIGQVGTTLTIDIKERDVTEYVEEEDIASSLYAPCDGVITSVMVRSGLSMVKPGDEVLAGELLVDGVLPIIHTDGNVSAYHLVRADADVTLCYTEDYYDEISFYGEEKTYTGESYREYYLCIGDVTMNFHWFSPAYERQETSKTFYQLELWEYFYLPVWFGVTEHKEYVLNRVKLDKKVLEETLYENLTIFLESLEEKGVQNIQKDVKISTSGSMLILSGELIFTTPNMLREEINTSMGMELNNGEYNSVIDGNER